MPAFTFSIPNQRSSSDEFCIHSANIPVGYYGNAVGWPHAISKCKHLREKSLAYAVELVKAAKRSMIGDYFRSVVIESAAAVEDSLAEGDGFFGVSDIRFFGEIDYGWGFPAHVAPLLEYHGTCYLTKYRNIDASECVVAVMSLLEPVMSRFEHELKKLTATNYLSKL